MPMGVARGEVPGRPSPLRRSPGRLPERGDSGWASLAATRDPLAGRHDRIKERKKIVEDGTVVIERRHTPGAKAHRIRPLRFVRGKGRRPTYPASPTSTLRRASRRPACVSASYRGAASQS